MSAGPHHDASAPTTWNGKPKHPRDWRWVVGGVGRILIALGLLMFAFVAYQLWGTGLQTAAAQRELRSEFEELLATATTPTTVAPTTTSSSTPVGTTTTLPDATTTTTTPPTTVPASVAPPPPVAAGAAMGFIEIPAIGVDKIFVNGVSVDNLKDGPGHFPESVIPGQVGNTSLAGHRTTYGAPFFRVDEIEPGDEIIITTLGGRFVYVATETIIVGPNDFTEAVLTGVPDTATISLVSCHPRYTSRERIVVRGVLDSALSTPVVGTTTTLPGTTTTTVPDTLPDETTDSTPDTTPVTSTPSIDVDIDTPAGGEDAFSRGWFSDPNAWAQVAWWGLACCAVALAAYGISRLARRNWVGALVGIVPFVVVLYFFFENVHRLLPPGI